ncbi:hypothetical protein BBK82_33290 [Lentzea guizhouensis]|uniref:Uncharacterized protein n=1 Tax=Lentzea guizhouensis TaxID=1586287 RepID=A0A1B2HZR9_9PSEU|nr:hypothetical protein BBK82_33290 [Lentzea guizhouensis]
MDPEQIRRHATNVEAVAARFGAVEAASAHVAQDDQAYGLLCGWISAVLEGRHVRQDELVAFVAENLALAAASLRATADHYLAADEGTATALRPTGGEGAAR